MKEKISPLRIEKIVNYLTEYNFTGLSIGVRTPIRRVKINHWPSCPTFTVRVLTKKRQLCLTVLILYYCRDTMSNLLHILCAMFNFLILLISVRTHVLPTIPLQERINLNFNSFSDDRMIAKISSPPPASIYL